MVKESTSVVLWVTFFALEAGECGATRDAPTGEDGAGRKTPGGVPPATGGLNELRLTSSCGDWVGLREFWLVSTS